MRQLRRLFYFGIAGIPAAVANVVPDGIVEQHGVLRHHADRGPQRRLRDVADILAIDQNPAARDVIETKQQARDGGFAGAGRSDDRDRLAGRHLKTEAFEERTLGIVREPHILETQIARCHDQGPGAGNILDLGIARQNVEHLLDVDDRLLDLAIHHAHEIQRLVKLDHHSVDQDKIADGMGAVAHPGRAHQHDRRQAGGENDRLPGIENRKRRIGFDTSPLVALHRAVVALGFPLFEIFDGLVIQQRVDRLGIRLGIGVVHPAPNFDPPFGRDVGKIHEYHDRDHGGQHVAPVELPQQHGHQQGNLNDGRHQLQDHHPHDDFDAGPAALQHARQSAGLALEMKAQRQFMHVDEGEIGELAHRVHRHPRKNSVAPLRQDCHQHAQAAIAQGHDQRRGDQPQLPVRRLHRSGIRAGQGVDRPFERERHRDGRKLGAEQHQRRPHHPPLQVAPVRRPYIRPQPHQGAKQRAAAIGGDVALHSVRRSDVGFTHGARSALHIGDSWAKNIDGLGISR